MARSYFGKVRGMAVQSVAPIEAPRSTRRDDPLCGELGEDYWRLKTFLVLVNDGVSRAEGQPCSTGVL